MGKGRRRRNGRRSGGHPSRHDDETLASVIQLSPSDRRQALALADASNATPEFGKRTPQPSISRSRRHDFGDLTPSKLVSILERGEEGYVEELADLWLKMLRTDGHLRSIWETRVNPVIAARHEVYAPDVDESLAGLAEHAVRGIDEALEKVHGLKKTIAAMLDGIGLGFSVAEIIWRRGTLLGIPATVPYRLIPVASRRFGFSDHYEVGLYDSGRALAELRAEGWDPEPLEARGRSLARLPAGKYVVHTPVTIHDYPTGSGLVHSLARWWLLKQIGAKYWSMGAEMFAMPRYLASAPDNATDNAIDDLHAGLEKLAQDGVVVTRGETSIEVVDGKGEGGSRTWQAFVDFNNGEMSKTVLGSTLNVEVGDKGGAYNLGVSQADETITPRQEQDAEQLWESMRRDLFAWVIKYNRHIFPEGTPVPMCRSGVVDEPVTIDDLAISTGKVTVNQVLESRGLPPLPDEEGEQYVPAPQQPYQAPFRAPASEREADAPDPFAQVKALSRALSTGRVPTSSHSTTPTESER